MDFELVLRQQALDQFPQRHCNNFDGYGDVLGNVPKHPCILGT